MTQPSLERVLIMAGGTGGHVFPGLAVAKYLCQQGVEVAWLGTARGIESRVVPEAGIPLHRIAIQGVRGKGKLSLLFAPFRIVKAILQAFFVMRRVKPDVVLGFGGFVSGPGGVAAWLCGCPLIVHEQNAYAGLTNRWLGKLATSVLEGFPDCFPKSKKVRFVGNPVRADIERMPYPNGVPKRPLKLLVVGGSLGAKVFNDLLPDVLHRPSLKGSIEVWHQTGLALFEETNNRYKSMGLQAKVAPFIEDMAAAYAWADCVLCRAGALTVAELCAAGRGAIFVPYPYAVDDHQTKNARFMVDQGAALCVQQSALTADSLTDMLESFAADPAKCLKMSQAAYSLRKVGVPADVYSILENVLQRSFARGEM